MSLPVRLAGALDAINGVNPLCNPYLTGPDDLKTEWLVGYSFGQKLSPMDRVRLRLAIMQHTEQQGTAIRAECPEPLHDHHDGCPRCTP